jgi:hypothetical protein
MSDVLLGLAHLIRYANFQVPSTRGIAGSTTVPLGKPFEVYCKDWLSLTPPGNNAVRTNHYLNAFSYFGSANNPPDVMYKGGNSGDAFEFKKTQTPAAALSLNSSFPKNELTATSPSLLAACIHCEPWALRTFYYVVGHIAKNSDRVMSLWVVDGKFMADTHQRYGTVFNGIKQSVTNFIHQNSLHFIPSVEFGRVRKIDTLDRSVLRVRPMWELESPLTTFKNVPGVNIDGSKSVLHALILESRWNQYPLASRQAIQNLAGTAGFSLINLQRVPDPSSTNNTLSGKLIRYEV